MSRKNKMPEYFLNCLFLSTIYLKHLALCLWSSFRAFIQNIRSAITVRYDFIKIGFTIINRLTFLQYVDCVFRYSFRISNFMIRICTHNLRIIRGIPSLKKIATVRIARLKKLALRLVVNKSIFVNNTIRISPF